MPSDKSKSTLMANKRTPRSSKPLMEKRRRARINASLGQLKTLILEAVKKDPARHTKLEKADILEMTVRYLRALQRQQISVSMNSDPDVMNKYNIGYTECAVEATRYLSANSSIDPATKGRLLSHLQACRHTVNHRANQNTVQQQQNPHQTLPLTNMIDRISVTPTSLPTNLPLPTNDDYATLISPNNRRTSYSSQIFPIYSTELMQRFEHPLQHALSTFGSHCVDTLWRPWYK